VNSTQSALAGSIGAGLANVVGLMAMFATCWSAPLLAQPPLRMPPGRQNSPLSPTQRGQEAARAQESELTLYASLDGGHDNNVVGDSVIGANDPRVRANGSEVGGTVGLTYLVQRRRIGFGGSVGSAFRRYHTSDNLTTAGYNAGFGMSADPTPRTQLQASFSGSYSPFYEFSVVPQMEESKLGQIPGPVLDYGLGLTDVITYSGAIRYAYSPSRRSSFELTSDATKTDFDARHPDLTVVNLGGRFIHGLTRNASLNLGYVQNEGKWPGPGESTRTVRNHNIDIGVNYDRPLSVSRRTKVSFGFGSATLNDGAQTYFNVRGHASLDHEISRTWNGRLLYQRGFSFIPGLAQPAFADAFGFDIGGGVSRRLFIDGSGGYAKGDIGLALVGRGYDSYIARGRAQYLLLRWLSAYGEYFFYHYRFADVIAIPSVVAAGLNRRGARLGAEFVVPLVSQRRAAVAAR
jgi:hypothetical protein